ncbi:NAD(P)/FAD-dependent oxidoreductase [Methylotenera sp.]|uniref:NAD(P)/FAD-dependent oxidoreductase n=1 Tax=Methylotenera sp. TaxID=2051956 RepID=UPI002ED7CA90
MSNTADFNRRNFIKTVGVLGALAVTPHAVAMGKKPPIGRVVVIGGGYAGTSAAKYIRMWSMGSIEVVVIEPLPQFVSCPLSNLVLGGSQQIGDLTFGYDLLKKHHGIQWVQDTVTAVDSDAKKVIMQRGEISYDRLIVAPGVDFVYDRLPQLQTAEAQKQIPHAWKAGWQTVNLRQQLEAMPDGGVFVITIPKAPYRCPPGPYERICQVAYYLKAHKPKSKIIVLDANAEITSKKGLFTKVWANNYAGMIDYRPDSAIVSVDVQTKTVSTEFERVKANVLNVIPPQRAGKPAQMANLLASDYPWCEVDFLSYESKLVPNVHVVGDSVASGLPKSAHMATSQARVCASAIVELMQGRGPDPAPVFANTCYSFVDDKQAMHVANVYRYDAAKKIMVSAEGGGVSLAPSDKEGAYAKAWAHNIWSDVLT